jgi:hypothetical protein
MISNPNPTKKQRLSRRGGALVAFLLVFAASGCALLMQQVQPPRFSSVADRQEEIRLLLPSAQRPAGGVAIRMWARVENPNPVALTLSRMAGTLFLEGARTAQVDFPLGVPLAAAGDTIIPLEVSLSFSDVPGLAEAFATVLTRNRVAYRLEGTLAVDAGVLGQPTFGPTTWLQGEAQVLR